MTLSTIVEAARGKVQCVPVRCVRNSFLAHLLNGALEQGPRVPVYHYCGAELEGVASNSVVQKLVSAPFSSGALEQPRYGSVYHRL